jgi:hypothetical protein
MSDILDEYDDEQCIEYIKNYLPQELKDRFTDDDLYFFIDTIDDYYINNKVFDSKPDNDGYISVDLDAITDYIISESKKDKIGTFTHDEIFFVVQGEMEYEMRNEDKE